jgi:hypothetical protein
VTSGSTVKVGAELMAVRIYGEALR